MKNQSETDRVVAESIAKAAQRDIPVSLRASIMDGTPEEVVARYAALPAIAESLTFGAYDEDLVVLDTETTGLSFNKDELTQIAAARVRHGQIDPDTGWFITFVNPGCSIPEDIVHLTGITDEDVQNAPSPNEALARLAEFVGTTPVVAHFAAFDRHFVTQHPGGYPLLENQWIDSLDLARIVLPRAKSHRLIDLARAFDAPESTHRADEDVLATVAVLRYLFAGIAAMPSAVVRTIAHLASYEDWPTGKVFSDFAENFADSSSRFDLGAMRRERISDAGFTQVKQDAFDLIKFEQNIDSLSAHPAQGRGALAAAMAAAMKTARQENTLEFHAPSKETISQAFAYDGIIGGLYEDYEMREEQVEMSQLVRNAFEKRTNLIVEAGTGVGKSMAYLVPAAYLAKQNNVTVGVATKTNALLDQLVYHELPALAKAMGGLSYMPLKGFAHYPCLLKVKRMVDAGLEPRQVGKEIMHPAPAVAALLSFIEQTAYDDIDSLKIDTRVLPRNTFTNTGRECLRRKCPFYHEGCFVHGARKAAHNADIVVTNHTLMLCDVEAEGGLLPPIRHWIIDEAHGIEAEARKTFSPELSSEELLQIAHQLDAGDARQNVLLRAERKIASVGSQEKQTLFYALLGKAQQRAHEFAQSTRSFCDHVKNDLLYFNSDKSNKGYETVELWLSDDIRTVREGGHWESVLTAGKACMDAAEQLVRALQDMVAYMEDAEGAADVQREIASLSLQLKEIIQASETIFGPTDARFAYAATLSKKKDRYNDKLSALLLNVGNELQERFYSSTLSVVYASATLCTGSSFEAFERAVGFNQGFKPAITQALASSFDYDRNMTIYVPSDMPDPTQGAAYLSALESMLTSLHLAVNGGLLTLFTNRKEMEKCHADIRPALAQEELRLLCQKHGTSIKSLRDEFINDKQLSLFALKSFWEGFDAPGDTLKGVIIPKLPFAKPTDPLSCERYQQDDRAWMHYVLPQAIIETKQAVGRLIRKADDKGIVVLADSRLLSKSYGKLVLNSMPSRTIRVCTMAEMIAELENGFGGIR